jgi:hypothetical protein
MRSEGRGEMPHHHTLFKEGSKDVAGDVRQRRRDPRRGERAHRTACAALKHSFEKRGDRWVEKDKKGPPDSRAAVSASEARAGKGKTYGGVGVWRHSNKELMDRARQMGIKGRSKMSKDKLGDAIVRTQH